MKITRYFIGESESDIDKEPMFYEDLEEAQDAADDANEDFAEEDEKTEAVFKVTVERI